MNKAEEGKFVHLVPVLHFKKLQKKKRQENYFYC